MNTNIQTNAVTTVVSGALSPEASLNDTQKKLQTLKDRAAANTVPSQTVLEQARVGESATPFMAFSVEHEDVNIHWIDTPEKKGYILCNGNGCPLCRAGNKAYNRLLLPVFNFSSRQVEILAITDATHPKAALPQILPVFDAVEPMMILMSRHRNSYTVDLKPIPE
ncbi:hypothetical protein P3707_26915, partial [Vibrio parahaemolyticus]|nr:hypothetical protein [Vibrio parahaemolyticus]